MIDPRASVLIAGCVLLAGAIFVELQGGGETAAPVAAVPARTSTAPVARRAPPPRLDDLLTVSLARPLFNSSRRPPEEPGNSGSTDLSGNRLTGIITEPERRFAIFAVAGGKALVVSEGENVSGWRVDSITPTEITLSGPGGNKTLQPKTDPNVVRQAPPAPKPAQPAPTQPRPGAAARAPAPAGPGIPQPNAALPRVGAAAPRLNTPANAIPPTPQPNLPTRTR